MKRYLAQGLAFGVRTMPVVTLLALVADSDAAQRAPDRPDSGAPGSGAGDEEMIHPYRLAALVLLVSLLTACSGQGGQQAMCPPASQDTLRPMRTGYYPGYGCGFIPPAQTNFS